MRQVDFIDSIEDFFLIRLILINEKKTQKSDEIRFRSVQGFSLVDLKVEKKFIV